MNRAEYLRNYIREYFPKWRRRNPKRWREIKKKYEKKHTLKFKNLKARYNREHYLKIDGKYVRHDKGPRPKLCQLCGKYRARDYHHWESNGKIKGIWTCPRCHNLCEGVDQGLDATYRELRAKLDAE